MTSRKFGDFLNPLYYTPMPQGLCTCVTKISNSFPSFAWHYLCHGRFSFVFEVLIVLNPKGTYLNDSTCQFHFLIDWNITYNVKIPSPLELFWTTMTSQIESFAFANRLHNTRIRWKELKIILWRLLLKTFKTFSWINFDECIFAQTVSF